MCLPFTDPSPRALASLFFRSRPLASTLTSAARAACTVAAVVLVAADRLAAIALDVAAPVRAIDSVAPARAASHGADARARTQFVAPSGLNVSNLDFPHDLPLNIRICETDVTGTDEQGATMAAKTKQGQATNGRRAVLITDAHRGIYFGYIVEEIENGNAVRVENARHCYTFACLPEHPGVYGLASGGPGEGSRIGPRWNGKIRNVAKIVDVSAAAIERWEAAGWSK